MKFGTKQEKYLKIVVKLHFENTEEFAEVFTSKKLEVTRAIVGGIEKAVINNERTALLFEVTFNSVESMYEISLPKSQWQISLESCLDHLHELNLADEQIDTWKLLEAVKIMK